MQVRVFSLQAKTNLSLNELLQMDFDLFEELEEFNLLKQAIENLQYEEQTTQTKVASTSGIKIINNGDGTGIVEKD